MHNTNKKPKKPKQQKIKLLRSLITAVFITSGLFPLAPVLADGTPAGTPIDNTATATYEDPNNPPNPADPNDPKRLTSTSNKVTVTVAEVAGISVVAGVPVDNNGGTLQGNDLVYFPFTITNIGNDPTRFQIPTQAGITGPGTVGTLQYSADGTTWTNVPAGGFTTSSIPVSGTFFVRVPVTINSGVTPGQTIRVTLGETNPAETATNSPRAGSVNDARDVYTADNPDGTAGEISGSPANGVVEGSAGKDIVIDPKYYSLATILKTRSGYSNNSTPTDVTDDTITYDLSLRVESNDTTGQGITPSALAGSTVPGIAGTNILVSDAIPFGTELIVAPTAPTGWQVVYSTTPVTTSANAATWTTSQPTLNTVTRIGFIKPTTNGDATTYVSPGTTVSGFSIQVKVKTGQTAPLTIANIAQVFGKTPETNAPVLDESGDPNPSNFDGPPGNMTPPPNTDTNGDGVPDQLPPTVPDGFITDPKTDPTDLTNTGTDTSNNNSGTGTGGEANVLLINISSLLNGPNGNAGALGPTNNNNTDFTNKSSPIPANTAPGSTFNPSAVAFTNTVQNTGSSPTNISLVPTPPATLGDLPTGTIVTITSGGNSATYTYNGTIFTFTSSIGTVDGNPISATNPLRIDAVAVNGTPSYDVSVDLPAGTPLSTDIDRGFPVPITAFVDANSSGSPAGQVSNITIDRVYTGFLKLVKFTQLLQGTGPAIGAGQENFESTPAVNGYDPNPGVADVPRSPAPGNIIVYQIRYKNISEPATNAAGSVILNADKVVITEDGTGPNGNWAVLGTDAVIDTSNVANTAVDSVPASATITYFSGSPATTSASAATSGTTQTTDVTKYINSITVPIAPGVQRTFTFQRKVN